MKVIEFNENLYNIPEDWSEVTLRQVIDAQELSDLMPDAPLIAVMSAYTGIRVLELRESDVLKVQKILGVMGFLNVEYQSQPKNCFEFRGDLYSCLPDLAEQRFEDWLSIQTILYNNRENPVLGLSKMLGVYCKRSGETLDSINLDDREKLFMDLPFTVVKDVEGFFLANLSAWQQIIQLSSGEQELEKQILESFIEVSNIMKARAQGLGWYSPTRLVIGIYRYYLNYLRKELERSFNMLATKP